MSDATKISYAANIRHLFRDKDVNAMKRAFDLSKYQDVHDHADNILKYLAAGRMPCDGAWPAAQHRPFSTMDCRREIGLSASSAPVLNRDDDQQLVSFAVEPPARLPLRPSARRRT
jgi:hypothetical protein